MANQQHLDIFKQGVRIWNKWRQDHPDVQPDLSEATLTEFFRGGTVLNGPILDLSSANLTRVHLSEASLGGVDLRGANLRGAVLNFATLSHANLSRANLVYTTSLFADFTEADLSGADLGNATLIGANLMNTNLSHADLSNAELSLARLLGTNLNGANLTNCSVYGTSVWDVHLEGAIQSNLIITLHQPTITVDNLKIAQFIYLLLNNAEIRDVIDTLTTKSVLILGRFTPERKAVLDALREALRTHGFLPILFDFDKPASRDITETVSTLAHLARFVIADITDAKSIPQELMIIVPNLPSVPVQPLILESQLEYGMFEHFTRFPWVLPLHRYTDQESLLRSLKENIIDPAEQKAQELAKR